MQLDDHSTIMAPISSLMYTLSSVPNKPYIDSEYFPEIRIFRDNWETIRDECFIPVDEEDYSWRDGEDVIFDETFIHNAENNSRVDHLIFFCDVVRPVRNPFVRGFNLLFGRIFVSAAATKNFDTDTVGILKHAFHYVYQIRQAGNWPKKYNKNLYYIIKYILFAVIICLIF